MCALGGKMGCSNVCWSQNPHGLSWLEGATPSNGIPQGPTGPICLHISPAASLYPNIRLVLDPSLSQYTQPPSLELVGASASVG